MASFLQDLLFDLRQTKAGDWLTSKWELWQNDRVVAKLKRSFQPDPEFAAQYAHEIETLRKEGVLLLPSAFSISEEDAQRLMEITAENGYESDSVQTWFPTTMPAELKEFSQSSLIKGIIDHARGYSSPACVSRLYISHPLPEITGSFLWHHDGLFHYYKALLYLTDVGEEDGPFEYVPGSNQQRWRYYSYTRSRFEPAQLPQPGPRKYLGKRGDLILLDANGIHRAANPVAGRKRLVASTAFVDFYSDQSTDHIIAQAAFK